MAKTVAEAVALLFDPQIALAGLSTMDEVKDKLLAGDRFTLLLYGCFGVLALLLASIGIYGVMAFIVSQRTQEIGLRIALGASRGNVTSLIVRQGTILAMIGLGLGLGGAVLVDRAMQRTLFGVAALDPFVIASVAAILLATAVLACYLPARRAAGIDPMQALRTE